MDCGALWRYFRTHGGTQGDCAETSGESDKSTQPFGDMVGISVESAAQFASWGVEKLVRSTFLGTWCLCFGQLFQQRSKNWAQSVSVGCVVQYPFKRSTLAGKVDTTLLTKCSINPLSPFDANMRPIITCAKGLMTHMCQSQRHFSCRFSCYK